MKTTPTLLAFSLALVLVHASPAAWRGEVSSSSGASGRAAAYDAACLSLADDIGRRLAAESNTYRLFRDEGHAFGIPVGCEIAHIWLRLNPERIRRRDAVRDDVYSCEITLEEPFPDIAAVRRDLLTDVVFADRRIHPLVLLELTSCDDERENVICAFVDRLSSPVLSDYFLRKRISSYSPSAAFEIHRHPEMLAELRPPELLQQLQELPGNASVMKALIANAAGEGRNHTTNWLWNCTLANTAREPKLVRDTWPHVLEHARRAHAFVTPALVWFYAKRRISRCGSAAAPTDASFAKARTLAEAGLYREAYGQYLRSADLVLSCDACLGASDCAAHVPALAAEADFFLLQAIAIDPKREPARTRLFARERALAEGKGGSDD